MPDARVVEGVVRREVRAARKAEYDVHTLRLQALHQSVDCTHSARLLSRLAAWARTAVPCATGPASLTAPIRRARRGFCTLAWCRLCRSTAADRALGGDRHVGKLEL